jgi:bifunctional non-homologous end joining protein LigD
MGFDLLELDGEDLQPNPLLERKAALRRLLRRAKTGVHFVDHLEGDGAKFLAHACELGLEGIVSKDQDLAQDQEPAGAWHHSVRRPRCASANR